MGENRFDLGLGLDVHVQIMFGARFGLAALFVLSDHQEGHQKDLDHVRDEKPEHEAHRQIELKTWRSEKIPPQPKYRPDENQKEERHGSDMFGYPDRQLFQLTHARL